MTLRPTIAALTLICACAEPGPRWALAAVPVGRVAAEVVVTSDGVVRLDGAVLPVSKATEGAEVSLADALSAKLDAAEARSVSLTVATDLTVGDVGWIVKGLARAHIDDLVLRPGADSAVGWRLPMSSGAPSDESGQVEHPSAYLLLTASYFSVGFEPGPDPLPQHFNVGGLPDDSALAAALASSPFRGSGGGGILLALVGTAPWVNVLHVVDRLAEAGYDKPQIALILSGDQSGDMFRIWNPSVGDEPDVQDTCYDLDAMIQRRSHLPAAALSTRWTEVSDPEQRGEDGQAYPVQSSIVASTTLPDGGQMLLVQCLVRAPGVELALGSAQHLVLVNADGTVKPRRTGLGLQECCGRTWWRAATLSSCPLTPGAVQLSGAYEGSGDQQGIEASKATLYLPPALTPDDDVAEPCETQGLVPRAAPDGLLVIEEGVVANPVQWILRTRTRMVEPQIILSETWTPVNQPGLTGVYDESLPVGPRGKKVSARRTIQWDPAQQRLVEPCPKAPRPDFRAW